MRDDLRKYCKISDDGSSIERFVCPVEGCDYSTRLGPGALRMHIIMKSDPDNVSRFCSAHQAFYNTHVSELGTDIVRYLSELPRLEID